MAESAALRAQLDAWRASGAERVDPLGFHRLDALARRLASADAPTRARLQPRIDALAKALGSEGAGVIVSQVVPFPWDASVKVIADYHAAIKVRDPKSERTRAFLSHVL